MPSLFLPRPSMRRMLTPEPARSRLARSHAHRPRQTMTLASAVGPALVQRISTRSKHVHTPDIYEQAHCVPRTMLAKATARSWRATSRSAHHEICWRERQQEVGGANTGVLEIHDWRAACGLRKKGGDEAANNTTQGHRHCSMRQASPERLHDNCDVLLLLRTFETQRSWPHTTSGGINGATGRGNHLGRQQKPRPVAGACSFVGAARL